MGRVSTSAPANDDSWLRQPLTSSAEIAQRYDDWASTYNTELVADWGYDAPVVAAQLLVDAGVRGAILDVGCGTGLVGRALAERGVDGLIGVDLSAKSLESAASTNAYVALQTHDFNAGSLPFEPNTFDAVICVGVLSYAHDPRSVVADFVRVTRTGGHIVFTHRVDLWDDSGFGDWLVALQDSGHVTAVRWTEPQHYMPGAPDVSDLQIRYVTAEVC
jgi:predicted TPR repeat methyltransferase